MVQQEILNAVEALLFSLAITNIIQLPILSKIFEAVLKTQLYNYFEKNNLFVDCQFGFRKGMSTVDAIGSLIQEIHCCFEEGLYLATSFIDLTKAFDSLIKNILIEKLRNYNLSEYAIALIVSYLRNRYQATLVDGVLSDWEEITEGIVQGSVMRTLFFIIFINDMPVIVKDHIIKLFIGDANISSRHKDPKWVKTALSVLVKELRNWKNANKLALNENKTTMVFSLRDTVSFKNPAFIKFLGVLMDPKNLGPYSS